MNGHPDQIDSRVEKKKRKLPNSETLKKHNTSQKKERYDYVSSSPVAKQNINENVSLHNTHACYISHLGTLKKKSKCSH